MSVLLVILPLLAAPVVAILPNGRLPWLFASAISWACFALAIGLLGSTLDSGTIHYELGGWPPPWGIEYRIDAVNAFVALIVAAISAITLPYAGASVAREIPHERTALFYSLFLLCLTGLLGITLTGDVFNLFVFLEISSLSSYALIGMGRDRRALTAAYQYLIMGSIGATFLLIGIGLLYAETGTLNMADLASRLPDLIGQRTVHTAFAFIVVGMCLKLALFPLHLWLPNAYAYAPSVITAFLASTATKVALYVLVRFIYTVFGNEFAFNDIPSSWLLVPLAVIGLVSTSVVAIGQNNIKRMLAYSSVAQVGYMVLGIGMATALGLTAALLHVFNHALMKGALFMALGCIAYRYGNTQLSTFRGLGRRMPWTMAAFVAGGLSLIGVPLTVGLISKWYLLMAAIELGWWPIATVVVIGSLLAAIYIWRVIETAYFQAADDANDERCEAPLSLLIPTWTLVLANIWFGVDTRLTIGVAERAAATLMGAGI